jgi:hypothetical protein
VCVFLIAATLAACARNIKPQKVFSDSLGKTFSVTIDSAQTGHAYPIYIYLPPSYDNGTASYPVIYATDGDSAFPPEGRFGNFRNILQNRKIEAILIGIGGSRWRSQDYVLPGAKAYHEFIAQELIPFVEANLRADPKRRILSGLSLGGSFVVTSLFLEAPDTLLFSHYISAEGSFFQPSFIALEEKFVGTIGARKIPATLILARGALSSKIQFRQIPAVNGTTNLSATANLSYGFSEATNSALVDSFYRRMVARHYVDLNLIETSFSTDHGGTDNPSFDDAMTKIFQQRNPQTN